MDDVLYGALARSVLAQSGQLSEQGLSNAAWSFASLWWSDRRVYEASGHLPFIEQREEFAGEYLSFLDAADGVTTSRELILDPSIEAIKAPVM